MLFGEEKVKVLSMVVNVVLVVCTVIIVKFQKYYELYKLRHEIYLELDYPAQTFIF